MKKQAESYEGRIQNMAKAKNQEVQAQEMKVETKLDRIQEDHEREIERLNRRHQEQMASLAQKLNYYRKT